MKPKRRQSYAEIVRMHRRSIGPIQRHALGDCHAGCSILQAVRHACFAHGNRMPALMLTSREHRRIWFALVIASHRINQKLYQRVMGAW